MPEQEQYPRTGIAAIILRGHEVLLGRSTKDPIKGLWVVPGGGVKPFESIVDTVVREVKEETGATIKPGSVLFVSEVLNPPTEHRIVIYVDAQYVDGELKAGDDLSDVQWVDVRRLGELQSEMTELTIDALYKYSMVLRARAAQAGAFRQAATTPETDVN